MFTGIIEELGIVRKIYSAKTGKGLSIEVSNMANNVKIGDSISVNGVCLTVTDKKSNILNFDVIHETLTRTGLGGLKINDAINIERSLSPGSRIGGHFVTGHIDYVAKIQEILKGPEGVGFVISLPSEFSKFVAEKGSIAVDGVSLTVASIDRGSFTVYLIPHTIKNTTFGKKRKGDPVNIEVDLLAKYVQKGTQNPNLLSLLKKYEYI